VQDGVCGLGIAIEHFYRFGSWQEHELNLAALGLALHFVHHRQAAVRSGADHQPMTFPGDLLLYGERRMPEVIAESLGRFFLARANHAAVDTKTYL